MTPQKQTMKAQLIRSNGGPEVFEAVAIDRPTAGPGQVLVRVAATSVNTADLMARSMGPVVDFIPTPPAVLGMDFAGTVAAVGDAVKGYAVGDAVYGCAGGVAQHQGALAEFIAADARLIAHKPASLTMVEAAALPLVAITAYEALFDRMDLESGQAILVHGGAGGVGHVAVQLAVAAGARVFATGHGEAQLALIAKLGATPIDYVAEPVQRYVARHTDGRGFDRVFDTVGGQNVPTAMAAVALNGQVATTVSIGEIDLTTAHLRGATLHVVYMLIPLIHGHGAARHGEILADVAVRADAGRLRPVVDSVFPLAATADAHRRMAGKGRLGKVVVQVAESA